VNRLLAAPVFALVMLGVGDQGMNLYACASSQRAAIQTNREMGEWIASNTARHGIVVGNFFNLVDVFYYSGFHFDPYESVENCPMGPGNVVHRNEDMRKVLENSAGSRPVYVVDADVERYEHQKAYHSNKYVAAPPGKLKEVARFKVFNRYWYIDPLKYFIPRWFISIPVYMDWSIDYYYNNETVLFSRVLKADYKIYRLEDISLKLLPDTPEPVAVAQSGKITVSSVLDKRNPGMSPAGLLSGSSIWHAQSPPKFPEWVEISYSDAFAIGSFSLLPQPNSHGGSECRRAPKDFVLQGSNDRTVWTDLLRVSDNTYHDGVEWRKWEISTASSWLYYRLQITSSGEPAFLTINQIRLDKAR
jgi:hypothetical protein